MSRSLLEGYALHKRLRDELQQEEELLEASTLTNSLQHNDYKKRGNATRVAFEKGTTMSYKQVMQERNLEREEMRLAKHTQSTDNSIDSNVVPQPTRRRKRRWDVTPEEYEQNKHKDQRVILESKLLQSLLNTKDKVPVINGIPLTDEILDKILPPQYTKIAIPTEYLTNDSHPDVIALSNDYYIPPSIENALMESKNLAKDLPVDAPGMAGVQFYKEADKKHFAAVLTSQNNVEDDHHLTDDAKKEKRVLSLLLKVKNGSQVVRKRSLRQLTDNARKFGPEALFNAILPLMLEPDLDDQERHLIVKLTGRIMFQLDALVGPYTRKILTVISPLLIDENFNLRLEARDIIANLSKAVGLATMIANLRPDLDNVDEYVRNLTSRVFAIVANTLGLVQFLPFLRAVVKSRKSWMARHTGIKIIQQLGILLGGGNGNSILPYLKKLIDVIQPCLQDEQFQVRTIAALTISQLADSVYPYGVDAFEGSLEDLWLGLKKHRGKGLAGFLRAIGSIISLMERDPSYEEYSNYYTKEITRTLLREFSSPDEDMKKTVLLILPKLPLSKQLIPAYQKDIIDPFLKNFWNRRLAGDSQKLSKLVVDATVGLGTKFDLLDLLERIIVYSKDENESLRLLCVSAVNALITSSSDTLIGLDSHLEYTLVDGVLYAFQEQTVRSKTYLQAFKSLFLALKERMGPHIDSIISTVLYRVKNKSPEVRQQATDLIVIIAPAIKLCNRDDDTLLMKLVLVLYESLGEVYPEVLGSIISALHTCLECMDKSSMNNMDNPSINQLLPTITPILKNRQEKVQEACIKLVGMVAQRSGETINAREWMRISFEMLDMLKSSKKRIRIAANSTFGSIARTIGPQDVLVMLLNNLRVQERQLRVCTAVAIGIVAETCLPYTVLPALMNEYRIPDKNIQNGILKSLSFLFEYIEGETTKDYLFAISPLIEDALTDRDQVHRQTAATVVKHIAMNCVGLLYDDYAEVLVHYLNLILPNIFETSPHVIFRILEAIESLRISIGIGVFSNYLWSGLFHPARKVRSPYWKMLNQAIIYNSDSLVPYYPRFDKLEGGKDYNIPELDIFI
ncbi:uncharacterized protein KQ657_000898 [Scheffersomyces spartinae]|uniref:Phosphatase PP2A regulatory subunit A/Splicing factor 3B subunit 1-like HEAT repeat domain-containing protein n=1 Tax=Scheffersomyces spartinae TaxID=45513 RepID=A0A9P7V8I6_9ASCO|nr:uncharacterized protein KQ657_000898 [Scheffersomyces spartinae]KAG7193144.1 hypothetical protein KQ657_000898 [Scheffersomyces spartinae]